MQKQLTALIGKAFSNQRELQSKLRSDWADQEGWLYYRAIWTEIAEAVGHTNWYWWKTGQFGKPMSRAQSVELQIELADILHFGLTLDIYKCIHGGPSEEQCIAHYYAAFVAAENSHDDLGSALEDVAVDAILCREFNIKKFARVCRAAGMDLTSLLAFYFAKSVLNQFRWDNGYNDKTYIKQWKLPSREIAIEDNTYLGELVAGLFQGTETNNLVDAMCTGELHRELYEKLKTAYATIVK